MSTRSLISMQTADDTYKTIYCHSDGYPTYNGAILLDYYNTPEKVDELLTLGDLSFLAEKLNPDPSKPHSFDYDKRQDGVTVAYGRDRGEENTQATDLSLEDLRRNTDDVDYTYIFTKENEWKYLRTADENMRDVKDDLDAKYRSYGFDERPIGYYGFLTQEIAEELKGDDVEVIDESNGIAPIEQE